MKEHLAGKRFANDEDLKDAGCITRQPHDKKRVYTNWCQGTTSALISKAIKVCAKTCIFSFCIIIIIIKKYLGVAKRSLLYGQRYVPKLV